jgi:hypothetical protein
MATQPEWPRRGGWAGYDGYRRPTGANHPCWGFERSKLALALQGSKAAIRRLQRWKVQAGRATAAQGGFPYPARTCAQERRESHPQWPQR